MGRCGAAFHDVTIVLTLPRGDVNNPLLGEQFGAFQKKPSDLGPSDLRSHLKNESQKTPLNKSLGFKDEAKWLAKLLDLR